MKTIQIPWDLAKHDHVIDDSVYAKIAILSKNLNNKNKNNLKFV